MPFVRPSKKVKRKLESNTELHIVPVMNLFLVIIPFLLLAVTFVQISVLDTTLPAGAENVPEEIAKQEEEKPRLNLTVTITDKGFYVAGAGGVIAGKKKDITLEKLSDGSYNYKALGDLLKKIRKMYPEDNDVVVVAEDQIEYQVVVSTMDTIDRYFSIVKIVKKNGIKVKEVLHPTIAVGAGVQ